jgi:hypothetical protein
MATSILGGIAQETTLASALAAVQALPVTASGARLVGTVKEKFRDDFLTFIDGDKWDVIQAGAGQTLSVDGLLAGSRYLKMTSGTTANAETIIRSKVAFGGPVKLAFSLTSSQSIANSECHIEMVEVDPVTGALITDTSVFTAPTFNNARNGFGMVFDGVSQNNAKIKVRGQGVSEYVSVAASIGTNARIATGVTPNFQAPVIVELLMQTELASMNVRAADSPAVAIVGLTRTSYVPNTDRFYCIQIRVKNLATAPASNTDWRIHFVRLLDATRLSVDFGMIGGSEAALLAPPVRVISTVSTPITGTVTASVTPPAPVTPYFLNSAATTNGALVITGTSGLTSLYATNTGAGAAFVKLYNKATAPVVGTDIPEMVIPIPAAVAGLPGVAAPNIGFIGMRFALGLGIAITGGAADTDTSAVAAGQVKVKLSRTA